MQEIRGLQRIASPSTLRQAVVFRSGRNEIGGALCVKNGKRGAFQQKAATVLPNRTAAA